MKNSATVDKLFAKNQSVVPHEALAHWLLVTSSVTTLIKTIVVTLTGLLVVAFAILAMNPELINTTLINTATGGALFAHPAVVLTAFAAYFVGGAIKGTFGIGMALIAVPVMATLVGPGLAIALVAFPLLLTNVGQAFGARLAKQTCFRYWRFATAMILVMAVSASLAARSSDELLFLSLGGVAVLFAITNLSGVTYAISNEVDRPIQWIAGSVAGLMGGFAGVVTIPLVGYLCARHLPKDEFVAVSGFMLMISGAILALSYAAAGQYSAPHALYSLLMTAPAMTGLIVGHEIRRYIAPDLFRKLVLVLVLAIGINLIVRGLS